MSSSSVESPATRRRAWRSARSSSPVESPVRSSAEVGSRSVSSSQSAVSASSWARSKFCGCVRHTPSTVGGLATNFPEEVVRLRRSNETHAMTGVRFGTSLTYLAMYVARRSCSDGWPSSPAAGWRCSGPPRASRRCGCCAARRATRSPSTPCCSSSTTGVVNLVVGRRARAHGPLRRGQPRAGLRRAPGRGVVRGTAGDLRAAAGPAHRPPAADGRLRSGPGRAAQRPDQLPGLGAPHRRRPLVDHGLDHLDGAQRVRRPRGGQPPCWRSGARWTSSARGTRRCARPSPGSAGPTSSPSWPPPSLVTADQRASSSSPPARGCRSGS